MHTHDDAGSPAVPLSDRLDGRRTLVTGASKGLANEVGPRGVRVNVVSPGFIRSAGQRKEQP